MRFPTAIPIVVAVVVVGVNGCVLNVGIGGKRCDAAHDCVEDEGYVCVQGVCVQASDVRDAGEEGEGGAEGEGAEGEGAEGEGGDGEGEGEGAEGEGDGNPCIPAADGVERCNGVDDNCINGVDEGCENDCADDETFPDAVVSVCQGPLDWQSARDVCLARGMDLAVLSNAIFSDAVLADARPTVQAGNNVWIGASDLEVEGTFVWVDDEDFLFEDFDFSQPNQFQGEQDCVEIKDTQRWNDNGCGVEEAFVCASPPPPIAYSFCSGVPVDADGDGEDCDTDCDDGDGDTFHGAVEACDDRVDNDCDGVIDEGCAACRNVGVRGGLGQVCERITDRFQAADRCHDRNLQLGRLDSQADEDAVDALMNDDGVDRCWIGLNDFAQEGVLVWDDGAPLDVATDFFPIGLGQPSNQDATEDCFDLRDQDPGGVDGGPAGDTNFEWGDVECTFRRSAFLCTP